jgi:hypothetical protein
MKSKPTKTPKVTADNEILPKMAFVIVCGNRYQEGPVDIIAVCSSLKDARAALKEIEKEIGQSEYEEEDILGYSKECFYYLKSFPLNKLAWG